MKKLMVLFMIISLFAVPATAFADINDDADNGAYFQKFPAMFARGAVNVLTSPGYFFAGICNGNDESGVKGAAEGAVSGFGETLASGVGGLWDVATSWIPEYRGAGYQRGMWPDYEWEPSAA